MNKYMLFDLDGTLLPMDTDSFLEQYVRAITPHFAHLVEPGLFAKQLMASSYAMIGNVDPSLTNQAKFIADFFPKIKRQPEELMPIFDRFYEEHFPSLQAHSSPSPLSRQLVTAALNQGYKIVLATNPVFPREAVRHRMNWAGVLDLPWELVTSYEDTRFCKPNPAYFADILERLGADASQCVHIGNDMDEDMAASAIGIPVVMVVDHLINRKQKPLEGCLYKGELVDVVEWLEKSAN